MIIKNKTSFIIIFIIVLSSIAALNIATVTSDHNWGGDFSAYIQHAKNIVDSNDYGDTGYVYNPDYPLGPPNCAVGFPLLLAAVYSLFGFNLIAMKLEIIVFFVLLLLIIFFYFKDKVNPYYALTLIAIIGFHTYFVSFKESILSDIPFLFFLFLFLFIFKKSSFLKFSGNNKILAIFAAAVLYFSFLIRPVASIMAPSLLIYGSLHYRKNRNLFLFSMTVVFSYIVFFILGKLFIGVNVHYAGIGAPKIYFDNILHSFQIYKKVFVGFLKFYPDEIEALFPGKVNILLRQILFFLRLLVVSFFSINSVIGYCRKVRKDLELSDIFVSIYLFILLFWPNFYEFRYFIPLVPFCLFYAFWNLDKIVVDAKYKKKIFFLLLIMIFIIYSASYMGFSTKNLFGVRSPQARQFFSYIKNYSKQSDIFLFYKPRILSLFTGRSASAISPSVVEKDFYLYLEEANISYVVFRLRNLDNKYYQNIANYVKEYPDCWQEVFSNSRFVIYKMIKNPILKTK